MFSQFRFYLNLLNTSQNEDPSNVNVMLGKPNEYYKIWKDLHNLNNDLVKILELKTNIDMIETIIERIPGTILQLAFLFTSYHFSRLKIFLSYSVQKTFDMLPVEFILSFIFGLTIWSIINAIILQK